MWMSIRGHFASSTEIKFPIVLNFLKWLISVRAKFEKSAYSRRMLCFKSPTPKITGGWSGIRNSGRPDAKMQVRRYLRWAADGTFYSVGSGTEDTHNRTVTKPRTSATRASDSTGEQCLKQVDGPAGGFFIMAAGVFSPDGTRVIDLIFPPRWLVAAPKKKKQNTAICFRSFSKRMQTLHVARRLTCYLLLLDHFVLISVAPTQNEAKQSHTVAGHYRRFASQSARLVRFLWQRAISNFFFFKKTISSSFPRNFQCPRIRLLETISEEKSNLKRSLLIHFDSIIGHLGRWGLVMRRMINWPISWQLVFNFIHFRPTGRHFEPRQQRL